MSRWDAFDDEMAFLRHLTAAEEDRILSGRAPRSGQHAELATFARSLRETMLVEPDPAASAALIGRLAATARASASTAPSAAPARRVARRRPRLPIVARIAVAAALLPLLMAGLAAAGVTLPGPAQSAFEGVGIELPNQSGTDQSDDDGSGVGAGDEGTRQNGTEHPPSTVPADDDHEGKAMDHEGKATAVKEHGAGRQKSNPAREHGRGNGAQGRGRAIGKQGVPPGHSNPNRSGQGNGKAIGKTDSIPPGQAKPAKPSNPMPAAPKPKPSKPSPGAGK
jgi:hypothetical protein